MEDPGRVLITGASGLLGRSLVNKFIENDWQVIAHYFSRKGDPAESCEWIRGDLSTLALVRGFIHKNIDKIKNCDALINNYGPITFKDTGEIKSEDLISDFYGNLISANEITSVMLGRGRLKTVVNIGFEGVGEVKPYKDILPYAIAKSGLKMLTLSYDREFKGNRFFFISPPSLTGGRYRKRSGPLKEPDVVAGEIFEMISEGNNV